ncbi:helix-turn-helix domain-containing protein [Xanthomonas sp. SHU 199]|uniref:helix-turn-helix domain-containing protein n=1 Tax=Xanthomonas sp. SHU 199 TaxID=1591174 RepID=UPI00036DE1B1|nr:XRE family transcriptional regulator [Xanthomonas sp. SHU 199]
MDRREAFGQAIRQLRKAAELNQEQLAERLEDVPGLKQADISKIENGRHKSPDMHIAPLADALGVSTAEIAALVEQILNGEEGRLQQRHVPAEAPSVVPLIGWVRAGMWDQVENPFDPDVAQGAVPTNTKVSPRSYALQVKGDSMTNPAGWPTFPEGTTIIVDPRRTAESGDLVIAQVDEDQQATFKRLVRDAGATYLVPLNPRYPTLTVDQPMRICGVVVTVAERPVN